MKKVIFKVKHRLIILFYGLQRAFISIHKRDKSLIVYGGALDLFVDNAKHLFILNHYSLPEYKHVWLTRNDEVLHRVQKIGFEAVKSDSTEGRKLLLRAGMIIYDNRIDEFASHKLSSGALRFELWHGVTKAKMIGAIHTEPPMPYVVSSWFQNRFLQTHVYGDYVLATSEQLRDTMSAAFQIPVGNIIVADQPRNHVLYMSTAELDRFVEKYEDDEGQRLYAKLKSETRRKVIYMPTFRDADPEYIYKAIPEWDSFNHFLNEHNIVLYLKVHRVTPLPQGICYSNLKVMDNGLDIYPLLPLFDCLITDYSSVMFDFALMHKPIIIYDFDLEEYVSKSRAVFRSFINLLNELSEAKDSEQLKSLLLAPDSNIKSLSLEHVYDCSGDYSEIINFIHSRLKNQ